MTTTAEPRVQVRLEDDTAGWLADRTKRMATPSHNIQARMELDMWRVVLAAELRRIRLTLAQASCLADVLNGHLISPAVSIRPGLVYAEAFDAFDIARDTPIPEQSSYGAKWGIDERALLDYLARLGPAADHALLDAFSRWWDQNHDATVEGFAAVGLTVVPDPDAKQVTRPS
jgi:hypothetical protein